MSISSSAGIQITIPDLDDEDLTNTPVSFGRSPFGFGSRGIPDSPTASTPMPFGHPSGGGGGFGGGGFGGGGNDKGYFGSHSRGDSVASEDSAISLGGGGGGGGFGGGFGGSGAFGTGNARWRGGGSSGGGSTIASKSAFNASQTSLGTTNTAYTSGATTNSSFSSSTSPFTKKSSFASLRNAFKSNSHKQHKEREREREREQQEPPPVPSISDYHQGYPALKNPFNRSTSSLGRHANTNTNTNTNFPSSIPSPSPSSSAARPQTPSSSRFGNSTTTPRKSQGGQGHGQGHAAAKSQHSQNGSIFHFSDAGSDGAPSGFNFGHPSSSSSPPPVPRMPNRLFGGQHVRGETGEDGFGGVYGGAYGGAYGGGGGGTGSGNGYGNGYGYGGVEEDKVVMDPKTPSDFALHAVFMRFATAAENGITDFLKHPLDSDPYLPAYLGPSVLPTLDDTITSLSKIAQRHAKSVIDSVLRWRTSQNDNVSLEITQYHVAQAGAGNGNNSTSTSGGTPTSNSNAHSMLNSNSNPSSYSHPLAPPLSTTPSSSNRGGLPHDLPALLNERKSLASIYIMCRTLIEILKPPISKDSLGEVMGNELEKRTFDQFRKPNLKLLASSRNRRVNSGLYAELLGWIAGVRFVSVTDMFLKELGPVASGQVPKDLDMKYEHLVKGLEHIKIKVWPTEAFDEGAEFMESLSKSFANAHGQRLKITFAETLVKVLHPIGKTAQVETNDPVWRKAIELIYPKAKEMASKPRYWASAFPLVITSLCVAPQDFFLKNWGACLEGAIAKLKEKPSRVIVMNGIMRLIWTYLYRCQESGSTTTSKLETTMKHFFPTNRPTLHPSNDECHPILIYILHFILSRHPEFGRDLCMELITDGANGVGNSSSKEGGIAPDRTGVAVQAILLSVHVTEREEMKPSWPSGVDFSIPPSGEEYPVSAEYLPLSLAAKPSIQAFFERCGPVLAASAASAASVVAKMSIFDDQYAFTRVGPSFEEAANNYIVRRHPGALAGGGVVVAYPTHLVPQIHMLQTCFVSWPRWLHGSMPFGDAVDVLVRCVMHVEPSLAGAAVDALGRFVKETPAPPAPSASGGPGGLGNGLGAAASAASAAAAGANGTGASSIASGSPKTVMTVLTRFSSFLFSPMRIAREASGVHLMIEGTPLLDLWSTLVEDWATHLVEQAQSSPRTPSPPSSSSSPSSGSSGSSPFKDIDTKTLYARLNEVESGALFLLSHQNLSIRRAGTKVVRALGLLAPLLTPDPSETPMIAGDVLPLRIVELLHGKGMQWHWIEEQLEILESKDLLDRTEQILALKNPHALLQIAESEEEADRLLWRHLYPRFLQLQMDPMTPTLVALRETVVAAATRYIPLIAHLAGLSTKVPAGLSSRMPGADGNRLLQENTLLVGQWYAWIKILCSTAILQESRPAQSGREHSRAPSDANFERERLSTTRGLFRYLTPFLDSDYLMFRDAAVLCVCSFPSGSYPQLLEDLSLLAGRQFYDDPRSKGTRRHERLHSAVARIYFLTAPLLEHQRSLSRQTALTHVLKFVRNTQSFLTSTEIRDKHQWQLLRRYFCGTVERLFDCLASLKDTDRFISRNMHLTLYRLCEEWCQLGPQGEGVRQRLVIMQRAANSAPPNETAGDPIERFQQETLALSDAAVGALSSLCQKAFSPPDSSSGSPLERSVSEQTKPLSVNSVLERLCAILSSIKPHLQAKGKKALRFLLTNNTEDPTLLVESLRRAAVVSEITDTSTGRFFEVVVDIICSGESHGFSFAQVAWLGLVNLCHSSTTIRQSAFNVLERIHYQSGGLLSMTQFEPGVLSLAPTAYGHTHRLISDFLAGEHPHQGPSFLVQLSLFLPHLSTANANKQVLLMLLQSLECWIMNVQLMEEDVTQGLSKEGISVLANLMSLTVRFGEQHTEQIMALWTKLVEPPNQVNAIATVRFLLEQAHKVANAPYISCAANIVACLCQTAVGKMVYEELCSVIEPDRMIPVIEHKLAFPEEDDLELWDDLGVLFNGEARWPPLGAAQFAWLLLAEVTLQRPWELRTELPVLLHALLTHVDHRIPYIRQQAQRMLLQILRSCIPGYDDLADRANYPNRVSLKGVLAAFEKETEDGYWKEDEGVQGEEPPKMGWVCKEVLSFLCPLSPKLAERWGSLALLWGTSCSIRATACRSLQIFRALASRASQSDLALLLGRLSNTIADPDPNIQRFTSEILLTFISLAQKNELEKLQLPQFFWCTCACLGTPVEEEFKQSLVLLETILARIDLDDPVTATHILTNRPRNWAGTDSLQPLLMKGLRSSVTALSTLNILQQLAYIADDRLIDPSSGRVRDLYTISLPWCLRVMTENLPETGLTTFAENIARLAKKEGRDSISKIMVSLSKSAFRTKEDFLRQSISSLREHYSSDGWSEVTTLLLGLVLNSHKWLRSNVMQLLKVLFQQRGPKMKMDNLASVHLMPLLRLLETDLATEALDVLEEPLTISGGPAAKHVLRMSMHAHHSLMAQNPGSETDVFGVPQESGWCVPNTTSLLSTCRNNVMAVFDTCSMPSRPSQIRFEPEVEMLSDIPFHHDRHHHHHQQLHDSPVQEDVSDSMQARIRARARTGRDEDLGGLVQNLHELTSFFQEGHQHRSRPSNPNRDPARHPHIKGLSMAAHIGPSAPSTRIEARVAAILAKSTADPHGFSEIPPTPFVDVFKVDGMDDSDEDEDGGGAGDTSYDDEESDEDEDAFIWDSMPVYQSAPNGASVKHH